MFYSIAGIVVGVLLFGLTINNLINKKDKLFTIINTIFSLAYIGVGTWSFFMLGKDLEFIPMVIMLGISIVYIIFVFVLNRKESK